ncbi:MAG: hypothetical protein WD397_05915 [Wenzhouxiangellaceae bacterium]
MHTAVRVAVLVVVVAALGGCATYHRPHYPDSGVYYGAAGGYGYSGGYSRAGYGSVNPVHYPYWSLDHFYFSHFYHPYSVFVGYSAPLYYPYPGWALAHHRPLHSRHFAGFGYPWHGFGHRYPAYTFGFFASHRFVHRGGFHHRDGHRNHDHPIRHIDRRLEALQHGNDRVIARRELMVRDRVGRGATGYSGDRHGSAPRVQSRAAVLQGRDSRLDRTRQPNRARQIDRREADRNEIRRSAERRRSDAQARRGIPIEHLRGRVIVNSRNSDIADRSDQGARSLRGAGGAAIRRAPAPHQSRSRSESASRAAAPSPDTRARVLNRSDRGDSSDSNRSSRRSQRQTSPPRSRADEPSSRPIRSSSPRSQRSQRSSRGSGAGQSRRSVLRGRSGDNHRLY